MTGSGKSAAFLLPILERLLTRKRGATRAPDPDADARARGADHEHLSELAVHTPVRGAAVYGGVGMGPQEHALPHAASDVIVATPGRLLDHMRHPYASFRALECSCSTKPTACSTWASCPTSRRSSAACREASDAVLLGHDAAADREARRRDARAAGAHRHRAPFAPAVGITQADLPVSQARKTRCSCSCCAAKACDSALVFTRTKHRANAWRNTSTTTACARIASTATARRRSARRRSTVQAREDRVLVATDIAARGIDVTALAT
jgi:ATP-dependent RNA helicase RhlE